MMTKQLTTEDLQQIKQLHDSGITYNIIAALYKVSYKTLHKQLKHYDDNRDTQ